jgi:ATPase family protein associated with various cellular activities (AAA)
MTTPTRSQLSAADIAALLRARNAMVWVDSQEEVRAELYLVQACKSAGYMPAFWDCAAGLTDLAGNRIAGTSDEHTDPGLTLDFIRDQAKNGTERTVWIMRDLHKWLEGGIGIGVSRRLRNLARTLPALAHSVIILAPSSNVPAELSGGDAVVLSWPLPDREEIGAILDRTYENAKRGKTPVEEMNGNRPVAVDAAVGLSGLEAEAAFAASLVKSRRIDPEMIGAEKKRVLARNGLLQWVEPLKGGLDSVGGLDVMKGWLIQRKLAFSPDARAYGLPSPKGVLVIGMSGCGKTYSAKATATAWRCPLIKADLGALQSKFVGESQKNIREMQRTAEALGRVVLWFDEIDKSLAGSTGPQGDGGVAADQLGAMLQWMNDRTSEAFIFATANDVSGLPPELLRKGRWDELFFVDLPTRTERGEILKATLRTYNREAIDLDYGEIIDATAEFTGAEIAALVPEAMFTAYADDKREIKTHDLLAAAGNVTPLARTMPEKVASLRTWSKRARLATSPEGTRQVGTGRALDLGN